MYYHEVPILQPRLGQHVAYLYVIATNDPVDYFAVPNGKVGVTVQVRGCSTYTNDTGQRVQLPRIGLFGLVQRPTQVHLSADFLGLTAVVNPGSLGQLGLLPVGDWLNQPVDLATIWGQAAAELPEQLARLASVPEQLGQFTAFLHDRIALSGDERMSVAIASIQYHRGQIAVDAVSQSVGLTERRLRSLFADQLGMSPKAYCQLIRFYQVLLPWAAVEPNLAQVALAAGYYDQAHFDHQFKQFVQRSPRAYFNNQPLLTDFQQYKRWLSLHFVDKPTAA